MDFNKSNFFNINREDSILTNSHFIYRNSLETIDFNIDEILLDGINIRSENIIPRTDFIIEVKLNHPFVQMVFTIDGKFSYIAKDNQSFDITFESPQQRLIFFPKINGELNFIKEEKTKAFIVTITLEKIKSVFGEKLGCLNYFGECILRKEPIVFNTDSTRITNKMQEILNEIMTCSLSNNIKNIFLETKVIELFILQLDCLKCNFDCKLKNELRRDDLIKLNKVKKILDEKPHDNYSIESISRNIGINSFKLKSGFKDLFGTSVIAYVREKRLEKAKLLLINTTKSINEIAEISGYKNPQHFTAAFKKKFLQLPKDVR
jgi:AraC-like DNA-binding protein